MICKMNRIFFKKKFFFVSVFFFVCFVFICVKKTPETPQKKKRMFPSGFTEAEIEFAVSVGTQAVYQTRKHNAAEPTTDFASAMKEAFNSEVKAENEGLRAALAQRVDDQKLADLQKDLENVRADLAAKRADAQQMLNLAEAERLKSHSELERLAKQLSEERTHAETLKKELAILKISTCKGEVGEESVFEALSSSGLFAVRVGGNDQHHGHYHDVLCAETTLMRSDDLVFPRYATDDAEPPPIPEQPPPDEERLLEAALAQLPRDYWSSYRPGPHDSAKAARVTLAISTSIKTVVDQQACIAVIIAAVAG